MKRRIILPVAAVLGVAGLLGAAPAEALPACGYSKSCITEYYTDKWLSPSGMVGMRGVDCGNRTVSWGVVTPHSKFVQKTCLNN
jgi:hypothetical protein